MNNYSEVINTLRSSVGSNADYVAKTLDDARQDLVLRAEQTASKLRNGEVRPYSPAPMARQQKNTKLFCVKIGYGGNNAYFANAIHAAGQSMRYETAEEAASVIENLIIPSAKTGMFDEGLQACLEKHKLRAKQRVDAFKRTSHSDAGRTEVEIIATPDVIAN